MVSALMMSGAIPTLMYYGFGLISPTYFYFSAFALCSVIGISIGSSFDDLCDCRRGIYGDGGCVSCRYGDDGRCDCVGRVLWR